MRLETLVSPIQTKKSLSKRTSSSDTPASQLEIAILKDYLSSLMYHSQNSQGGYHGKPMIASKAVKRILNLRKDRDTYTWSTVEWLWRMFGIPEHETLCLLRRGIIIKYGIDEDDDSYYDIDDFDCERPLPLSKVPDLNDLAEGLL